MAELWDHWEARGVDIAPINFAMPGTMPRLYKPAHVGAKGE